MESFAAGEGVGLGKELVLNADPGDVTLAQLAHEPAHVVEVAVAGVAIYEDGLLRGVGQHSSTWVQDASLLRLAEIVKPEAQMPRNPLLPRSWPRSNSGVKGCAQEIGSAVM